MSVSSSGQSLSQQVVDPSSGQAHALMVPVTFENCHQAIRIRMAAGLNLPPRFLSEVDHNVPCLVGHPLGLSYALPPQILPPDNVIQPSENNAVVVQSAVQPQPTLPENIPQPLFTHNGQPIAVRLPLPSDNHPQFIPYRPPNLVNENRGSVSIRQPHNDEASPEIDPRIPPRFVRLEGTNFSGLRGNSYRPTRREGNKDFQSGSSDR